MITSWMPYVFVRFLIALGTGVLLGVYLPAEGPIMQGCVTLTALASIVFVVFAVTQARRPLIIGAFALTVLTCTGYLLVHVHNELHTPSHFSRQDKPILFYKAVVTASPQEKEKFWKAVAVVRAVNCGGQWQPSSGKVLLSFSKKDSISLRYGDVLLIKGEPHRVPSPANPHEFDYQKFLSYKNVYHQQFLSKKECKVIAYKPESEWMKKAIMVRTWAACVLQRYVQGNREQHVVKALVLGNTDGMDSELLQAYSLSGTLHVLAVSGLHVGIIYGILLALLKPFANSHAGRWALAGISIAVLWAYAFVTGLSPSVLRAVTMFSFMALAKPMGQRTNIYNTLALSAFCLLLYDPFLIMSVGFQLSYIAVAGIVFLYPRLYFMWKPSSWGTNKIWQLTAVSIAAQVATFPVGLLYFHQFPVYFLFFNLVAIPLSSIILVGGLLLLAVAFLSPVASALGIAVSVLAQMLNKTVALTEVLPFHQLGQVYINVWQCLLIMAMIATLVLLFVKRRFFFVHMLLVLAFVFSFLQWSQFADSMRNNKMVVYHLSGHTAIDIMSARRVYSFVDKNLSGNAKMDYHVTPNRLHAGISQVVPGYVQTFCKDWNGDKLIRWKGRVILVLNGQKNLQAGSQISVDYLIVAGNAVKDISGLANVRFKELVLDGSNSFRVAEKLFNQAQEVKLNVHSVFHSGAFEIEL